MYHCALYPLSALASLSLYSFHLNSSFLEERRAKLDIFRHFDVALNTLSLSNIPLGKKRGNELGRWSQNSLIPSPDRRRFCFLDTKLSGFFGQVYLAPGPFAGPSFVSNKVSLSVL